MNGYLVLGQCIIDDIPLGLFADRAEADAFAKAQTPESLLAVARSGVYRRHTKTVSAVAVVEFAHGRPVAHYVVTEFEDERTDA